MAKSKSFFGLRRGSTKTLTFQVNNGQQITKDRVSVVRNPRTRGQIQQRTVFMDAVKFYTRGVKQFFKFAFEDKKQTESDYNAFMRKNAKLGIYLRKQDFDNPVFPAIGRFYMTYGSMVSPVYEVIPNTDDSVKVSSDFAATQASVPTTIGALSALLKQQYGLLEGDIVTMLVITSGATLNEDGDYAESGLVNIADGSYVVWHMKQFFINSNDTTTLASLDMVATTGAWGLSVSQVHTQACGGCIIFSRKTSSGLKVSTAQLALNKAAEAIYDEGRVDATEPEWLETVLQSWSVAEAAILEGGLASNG